MAQLGPINAPKNPEEARIMWGEQRGPQTVLTRQPKPQPSFPTTLQALAEQVGTHTVRLLIKSLTVSCKDSLVQIP